MYANIESISPTPFRYFKMTMLSRYARTMMAKNDGSLLGWMLSRGFLWSRNTWRGNSIRIISARSATPTENNRYMENK